MSCFALSVFNTRELHDDAIIALMVALAPPREFVDTIRDHFARFSTRFFKVRVGLAVLN